MQRWLESGDAILVAEAEAFFSLRQGENQYGLWQPKTQEQGLERD